MQPCEILKAGLLYFLLVFAVRVVLGTIRTLCSGIGQRCARGSRDRSSDHDRHLSDRGSFRRAQAFGTLEGERAAGFGVLALMLMLASEFTFVFRLPGSSFRDYVTSWIRLQVRLTTSL